MMYESLHYASIPIEKLHKGILVKCFPQALFSQCIIFSDKIFDIQYLISFTFIIYLGPKRQYHRTRQARAQVEEGRSFFNNQNELLQAPVRMLFQSEEEDQSPRRAALVCSCEYSPYLSLRQTS